MKLVIVTNRICVYNNSYLKRYSAVASRMLLSFVEPLNFTLEPLRDMMHTRKGKAKAAANPVGCSAVGCVFLVRVKKPISSGMLW